MSGKPGVRAAGVGGVVAPGRGGWPRPPLGV